MKTIMRGLTLAAVLLTGAVTQAEVVIDPFSASNGNNGNGSVLPTGAGPGSSRIFNNGGVLAGRFEVSTALNTGEFRFGTGPANTGANVINRTLGLSESFAAPIDLHSAGRSNLLKFGFSAVAGQVYDLVVQVTDGLDIASVTIAGVSGSGTIGINGSQFKNGAVASNATGIFITVQAKNNILATQSTFTLSKISAVPEPATMSLLGLTAIGGIFAHRRRKNQLAA